MTQPKNGAYGVCDCDCCKHNCTACGRCRSHRAYRTPWPMPWQCSSNALPDPSQACRRRIWLPLFWGGHCHRCMVEARSVSGA